VKSVKAQTDELTLAIGDGSNDVNMITVADVGISIRGV
jgi:P-type E1-E2 ATPase